jgi:hypothetical protein
VGRDGDRHAGGVGAIDQSGVRLMATRRPVGSLPIAVWAVLQDGRIVGGHPWVAVFWTRTSALQYLASVGRGSVQRVVITDFVPVREKP